MQNMLNRAGLILAMEDQQLDLGFTKEFSYDQLSHCCERLKKTCVPFVAKSHKNIQQELIKDHRFTKFLVELRESEIDDHTIDKVVFSFRAHQEALSDYPARDVIEALQIEPHSYDCCYDYLKYFSRLPLNSQQQKQVISNLKVFYWQDNVSFSDLSPEMRNLFLEPYMENTCLVPHQNIYQIYELLVQDSNLQNLIRFLHECDLWTPLTNDHYIAVHKNSAEAFQGVCKTFVLLGKDSDSMSEFMERWLENNCALHDLMTMEKRMLALPLEERREALNSRSAYINLLYGGFIKNISLSELDDRKEDIIIYAIANKKKGFLRLAEENWELFSSMKSDSILFNETFYREYINVNTLNGKNLKDCSTMLYRSVIWDIDFLKHKGSEYTFAEVKALYKMPEVYSKLYARLGNLNIDVRLIAIRELVKRKALRTDMDDAQIESLAEKINCKPLSRWISEDFSHIAALKPEDAALLLASYDEICHLIPLVETRLDALILLQSKETAVNYNCVETLKDDLLKIDHSWKRLVGELKLNENFIEKNRDNILLFLSKNNADIALTYHSNLTDDTQKEAFRRIVKAELMGEFKKLKYYEDDLKKELDYPLSLYQSNCWTENTVIAKGGISVIECDDFHSTMILGETPQRTCLSYKGGAYNYCLLSSFDSNKKLLYVHLDGEVVGRAIIRLTKGCSYDPKVKNGSLSFVDLEKETLSECSTGDSGNGERLVLFLERYYCAGIPPEVQRKVIRLLIEIASEKASTMGCALVLSDSYGEAASMKEFTSSRMFLYISKSKAGSQYLDSLSGAAKVSDEGNYKTNSFYVRQTDLR